MAGLVVPLLLAGCAGPQKASVPAGLAYECDPGGAALIRFEPGGYLPGETALGLDGKPVPRSVAHLRYGGSDHRMIAEWTQFGLRYRSEEPRAGGRHLIWASQGEEAAILESEGAGAMDVPVATCTRSGQSASPGPAEPRFAA